MPGGKEETRKKILAATWRLLEEQPDESVNMADIARAAGVSRQALYLHFETRTSLMLATVRYVDEVKGLNERLKRFEAAKSGLDLLESSAEAWGNYIPEIYGLTRALRNTRDRDEATAAAWNDAMQCVRDLCAHTVTTLQSEGLLHSDWSRREAVELMWAMISIETWERLVIESGFTTKEFVALTTKLLKRALLVRDAPAGPTSAPSKKTARSSAQKKPAARTKKSANSKKTAVKGGSSARTPAR